MNQQASIEELKECPFCGGKAEYCYSQYEEGACDPIRDYVKVACRNCGVTHGDQRIGRRTWGKADWTEADKQRTEKAVADEWNRRTEPSPAEVSSEELTDQEIDVMAGIHANKLSALVHFDYRQFARAVINAERALNQRLAVKEGDLPRDDTGRVTSDYEPTQLEIDTCRNAIRREFGNNGTDGYYYRILKAIYAVAPHPVSDDQQAKDAARYRFIRNTEGRPIATDELHHLERLPLGEKLDVLIDAAISTTKQEGA